MAKRQAIVRTLRIREWRTDSSKRGNIQVRFSMTYTHPLRSEIRYSYLTGGENKGWYSTKATPTGTNRKGEIQLLVSDIKNTQLIAKVTKILNTQIDTVIQEITGEIPQKEITKTLTLDEIARPYDENDAPYGLAYKWWLTKRKPAWNTIKTRKSTFNQHIKPNFSMKMSLKEFVLQVPKMQEIIDNNTIGTSKNIHIYLKMILDWALETGEINSTQHPMIERKLKRRTLSRSEEQAIKRENIVEKYLEPEEANDVVHLIKSWKHRANNEIFADIFRTFYLTGMRPSEVLGLNEDMIDFENKTIKVHWQRSIKAKTDEDMEKLKLKDEKERFRDDLKTTDSIREIPLTPKVEKIFKKYIKRNQFYIENSPTYLDMGYIFTRTYIRKGNKQGMPFVHTELSGFLRGGSSQSAKHNKKSGKPYQDIDTYLDFGRPIHILPHMFRHTYISILASHGLPLDSIRELVGHSEDSKKN
ncbi:site-specific integrase [Pseudolactococcus yaeyamensis]